LTDDLEARQDRQTRGDVASLLLEASPDMVEPARLLGIDIEAKKKKLATDQFAKAQKQLVGAPA
jgi:hypothetical protein